MKKLILFLFLTTMCFGALNNQEKKMLKEIYKYYSGVIPGVALNETIRDSILEGTEAERKAILKTYLVDLAIPSLQVTIANINSALIERQALLDQMQDWVDAN